VNLSLGNRALCLPPRRLLQGGWCMYPRCRRIHARFTVTGHGHVATYGAHAPHRDHVRRPPGRRVGSVRVACQHAPGTARGLARTRRVCQATRPPDSFSLHSTALCPGEPRRSRAASGATPAALPATATFSGHGRGGLKALFHSGNTRSPNYALSRRLRKKARRRASAPLIGRGKPALNPKPQKLGMFSRRAEPGKAGSPHQFPPFGIPPSRSPLPT